MVHPSAAVIPAALAAAEDVRASGAELLRAIALGMECSVRVGLAARGGFHAKGFHTTAIAAPFGSCIAAGVLLDLTENQLVNALGLAGSMAAGLFEFIAEGSNVKLVHTGWGAQSGIQAARLAQAGMTGPASVFEGRYGLFRAHLDGGFDAEVISADLGTRWHQLDTSFKPYPCCHFLHAVHRRLRGAAPQARIRAAGHRDLYLPDPARGPAGGQRTREQQAQSPPLATLPSSVFRTRWRR